MPLSSYTPTTWEDSPSIATLVNATRLNKIESQLNTLTSYIRSGVELVVSAAAAATAVFKAHVSGDSYDRLQITTDGRIVGVSDATADPATLTGAQWILSCGATTTDGLRLITSSNANPGQVFIVKDHLDNPIFAIGAAGGPSVFGDNFRVFNGSDIFNPVVKLRVDGSLQMAKGDLADGVGVIAVGKASTAPTLHPDGTHTVDGSTTQAAFLVYMDPADNKLKAMSPSGTVTVLAT